MWPLRGLCTSERQWPKRNWYDGTLLKTEVEIEGPTAGQGVEQGLEGGWRRGE
jgi:hypothetical protein